MHESVQTKKQFLDIDLDKWNFQSQNFRPSQGAVLGFHFCEFDTAMNMCKIEDIFNFQVSLWTLQKFNHANAFPSFSVMLEKLIPFLQNF